MERQADLDTLRIVKIAPNKVKTLCLLRQSVFLSLTGTAVSLFRKRKREMGVHFVALYGRYFIGLTYDPLSMTPK